jgi:hypothetical protein
MSTPEFFGIFIAAASSVASVLFMMIGYTAAIHSRIRLMLVYLRMAGCLSLASWLVMLAVMVRCEKICWVVKNKPIEATPVVDEPQYTVTTPSGFEVQWSKTNAGLYGTMERGGSSIRIGGSSGRSL